MCFLTLLVAGANHAHPHRETPVPVRDETGSDPGNPPVDEKALSGAVSSPLPRRALPALASLWARLGGAAAPAEVVAPLGARTALAVENRALREALAAHQQQINQLREQVSAAGKVVLDRVLSESSPAGVYLRLPEAEAHDRRASRHRVAEVLARIERELRASSSARQARGIDQIRLLEDMRGLDGDSGAIPLLDAIPLLLQDWAERKGFPLARQFGVRDENLWLDLYERISKGRRATSSLVMNSVMNRDTDASEDWPETRLTLLRYIEVCRFYLIVEDPILSSGTLSEVFYSRLRSAFQAVLEEQGVPVGLWESLTQTLIGLPPWSEWRGREAEKPMEGLLQAFGAPPGPGVAVHPLVAWLSESSMRSLRQSLRNGLGLRDRLVPDSQPGLGRVGNGFLAFLRAYEPFQPDPESDLDHQPLNPREEGEHWWEVMEGMMRAWHGDVSLRALAEKIRGGRSQLGFERKGGGANNLWARFVVPNQEYVLGDGPPRDKLGAAVFLGLARRPGIRLGVNWHYGAAYSELWGASNLTYPDFVDSFSLLAALPTEEVDRWLARAMELERNHLAWLHGLPAGPWRDRFMGRAEIRARFLAEVADWLPQGRLAFQAYAAAAEAGASAGSLPPGNQQLSPKASGPSTCQQLF